MNKLTKSPAFWWALGVLIGSILIDQFIKIYVKTHFIYGEQHAVFGNWFKIYFIENEGMAYGMKLFGGGKIGKLVLTFFRIFVSFFGIWYLMAIIKNKGHIGLVISVALILAGAMGNIIDSVFYGVVFRDINQYFPGAWFEGNVVDMFYAPLYEGVLPKWVPFWGGQMFTFFEPIWNYADACITIGVSIMIIGQKKFSLPSPAIIWNPAAESSNVENPTIENSNEENPS